MLIGIVASALVVACTGPGPSHLVVYNQTTVPIVFSDNGFNYYVAPCSVAKYIATSATWKRDPPSDESVMPGAIGVGVYATSLPDIYVNYTATVTSDLVKTTPGLSDPSLPPCVGVPPSPGPESPYPLPS